MQMPQLLAAGGLDTLIGVAFVVISIISWLMNYLNSQAKAKPNPPKPGAKPVRPRSERIQAEIEQFMREQARRPEGEQPVRADVEKRPPAPRPAPAPNRPTPRGPAPRGPAARPASRKQSAAQPPRINESSQSPPSHRPGEDIAHRRSVGSENLGQSLREHVKATMVERVQSEAQAHLKHSVLAEATQHLGAFPTSGGTPASAPPDPVISSLASDLRSREGMQKALLMQMIMERPSLRRRRR